MALEAQGGEDKIRAVKSQKATGKFMTQGMEFPFTMYQKRGGKMRIVAAVTEPDSIRHYLEGTGQSAQIPTLAQARAPPQEEWDF